MILIVIPVVTCLLFGALYPLCFWLVGPSAITESFRKFNLGMTNFITGLGVVVLFFLNVPFVLKISVLLWKAMLISVSAYLWKRQKMNLWLMTVPCILGAMVVGLLLTYFVGRSDPSLSIAMLGGIVLCLSLFTMILGHWYLNVPGLPLCYLTNACNVFWIFLIVRLIWDIYASLTALIVFSGETVVLHQFIFHLEGFLLLVAVFFGTLLPAVLMPFVLETLKVKSTQSATGILYVIVIAVLMGDLAYKYYFFKFNLAL